MVKVSTCSCSHSVNVTHLHVLTTDFLLSCKGDWARFHKYEVKFNVICFFNQLTD